MYKEGKASFDNFAWYYVPEENRLCTGPKGNHNPDAGWYELEELWGACVTTETWTLVAMRKDADRVCAKYEIPLKDLTINLECPYAG